MSCEALFDLWPHFRVVVSRNPGQALQRVIIWSSGVRGKKIASYAETENCCTPSYFWY